MVCGRQWVEKHADTVERLLKAHREAEDFLIGNPEKSQAIIKDRLGCDDGYAEQIWLRHTFSLSFDQDLVFEMKDEVQWLINNEPNGETAVPDFVNCIYGEGLISIEPYSVDIVH